MADDNVGEDVMNQISKPVRSVYERVTHFFGDPTTPSSLAPKTWQADPDDVKKANDSFRKQAEDDALPTKAPNTKPLSQRTLGGVKRPAIKKPTISNPTQRKQP